MNTTRSILSMPLLSKLRRLEINEAQALQNGLDAEVCSRTRQAYEAYEKKIIVQARQHIFSNFPSYYASITSSDTRCRNRYGTFFREMNMYALSHQEFSKIIFDDKFILNSLISSMGHLTPKIIWLINHDRALNIENSQWSSTQDVLTDISHSKLFAKKRKGEGGRGAFLIKGGSLTFAGGVKLPASTEELLSIFQNSPEHYIMEESIEQSDTLSAINPTSINTIRCLTYLDRFGRAHVMGAALRCGSSATVVDFVSSGGLYCGINIYDGVIIGDALNKSGDTVKEHPVSSIKFADYRIPEIGRAFSVCTECHEGIGAPTTIGWDVAISVHGPVILEGNTRWAAWLTANVDPRIAARLWSAHLDDWGHLDIGLGRQGISKPRIRNKRLTVSVRVEGKVQKVGYRNWIVNRARARGLSGHVENLEDGSVCVVLKGPIRRVETMLMLVAKGPEKAAVSGLSIMEADISADADFGIRNREQASSQSTSAATEWGLTLEHPAQRSSSKAPTETAQLRSPRFAVRSRQRSSSP